MPSSSPLDNIGIVLVDTKTPANIGAAARCMMNMGLSRMVLVGPPDDESGQARKLAAGAHPIIEQAPVFPTLANAVAGHGLVIGASRHAGRKRKNVRAPRDMAETALPLLANNKVAVVFGNEVNGLELKDLALCHEVVAIPSAEAFPSLNLSHAVMVVAYELYSAAATVAVPSSTELARVEDLEKFYSHLRDTLQAIGFINRGNQARMIFSLRQLFGRARLDSRDIKILRGIFTSINRATTHHQ